MKVALVYVYPNLLPQTYQKMARRFVETYMKHPPGMRDHDICVVVNGGLARISELEKLFFPLECHFMFHDNSGRDIGGFIASASQISCDLMFCLGAPVHFCRAGWLDTIINAYEQNGPGLYGPWGFHQPSIHLRTTAFACPPELLRAYPFEVHNGNRYSFEHAANLSFTSYVSKLGLKTMQVTWDGCFEQPEWHHTEESETLILDQHCTRLGYGQAKPNVTEKKKKRDT